MTNSKIEFICSKAAELASYYVMTNQGGSDAVISSVSKVGQACVNEPRLVVAGAAAAIILKEASPCVLPVAKTVAKIADDYPKTTVLTSAGLCSLSLKTSSVGEPISTIVAGVSCTAALLSLISYLAKEQKA